MTPTDTSVPEERLAPLFLPERDAVEARWLAQPPDSEEAFREGRRLLAEWTRRVEDAGPGRDVRPFWVRRYWGLRERRAGLETCAKQRRTNT